MTEINNSQCIKIPTPRKIDNLGKAKDIITQIFTFAFVFSKGETSQFSLNQNSRTLQFYSFMNDRVWSPTNGELEWPMTKPKSKQGARVRSVGR